MADIFPWEDNDQVVVKTRMGIAVFWNVHGDICVRQEGQYHPDEDMWVTFSREDARAVAQAILNLAGETTGQIMPKDRTAADRQRRCRDKHRDIGVTERDVTAAPRDDQNQEQENTPSIAAE